MNLFETFKANKIDDTCASQVEEEKLVRLGLAYGDTLNYKQTFCQKKERKSRMDRADELRRKIRRVPGGKSNKARPPEQGRQGGQMPSPSPNNISIAKVSLFHVTSRGKHTQRM